ncbi:protein DpdH [Rhodococcus zopfii]|uniref:protein DpdH n=1 Tax=Rhodococcus zopfii TaxID=43772 RepID=UPI00364AE0F4
MNWYAQRPGLCWERETVLDIIPVEAESPSDGVFEATHSALPIIQRDQVYSDQGNTVDEYQLLAAVESQPADYPILPILGHSGTGKSHLVRWLRMRLEEQKAARPGRRLIFVPKHKMSLRAILDLILDHANSVEADEFRQRVHTATEQLSNEKDARNRLRVTLSYLIAAQADQPTLGGDDEAEERAYLAVELPNLLEDAVFKKKLMADDGAIARLVREKLSGKGPEDKDEPFAFTAADLHLTIDDTRQASAAARDIAETLGGESTLRELGAKMLNEQLSPAVSAVFGVGGDDLKDLLIDLRLELGKRGEELLLLIEDFSIFQGVQGGLIDAMTQIPTQGNPLCPMKVVMAVTSGYFQDQMPDTAKTRTYRVFDMDVPTVADRSNTLSFVAKYLNAVRVGPARIDAAYTEGEDVPNKCDTCPIAETCHTAFGAKDGIGLFPFNEFALDHAIRSQQKNAQGFVARDVLNRVLRPVLQDDREAIASGSFPTQEFETRFTSREIAHEWSVEDTVAIRSAGDTDELVNRRKRLLTFWAPEPRVQNLSPALHDAFSIPEVPELPRWDVTATSKSRGIAPIRQRTHDSGSDAPRSTGNSTKTRSNASPVDHQDDLPPLVKAVELWANGQQLQQNSQNSLRKLVFNAVVNKINFEDGLRGNSNWTISGTGTAGDKTLAGSRLFGQTSIFLEGTRQKDLSGTKIEISRDNIDAVRTLRALAYLESTGSWIVIKNGAELQRVTTRQVTRWAREIEEQLAVDRVNAEAVDPEVGFLADALLLSSQMLGVDSSYTLGSPAKKIESMFASAALPDPQLLPVPLRKLREFATGESGKSSREVLQKLVLRRTAYTQGGGKDAGVDTARIIRSHKAYTRNPVVPESVASSVVDYVERLKAIVADLTPVRTAVEHSLPDTSGVDTNVKETVKFVSRTLKMLQVAGMLPGRVDVPSIIRLGESIEAMDVQRIGKIREQLSKWDSLSTSEKLQSLSGEWPAAVARLNPWLAAVTTGLDSIESHVNARIDPKLQADSVDFDKKLGIALDDALTTLSFVEEVDA